MDLGIAGRKALLFGASRGMGRACAMQLAREGVDVTLVARTEGPLTEAATAIRTACPAARVTAVVGDLTRPEGRAAALEACPAPDILLNNADGPLPGDFRHWRRFGRILNIVSRSVKIPQHELGLSNGARSGLVGFTSGLARQTVQHNVTINNLLPGLFATDAQRRHVASLVSADGPGFDALWQSREAAVPARRFGDPAEFGAYAAFLCSAHAGYITAQNLLIDGGSYPATY